jgi:ribonuclease R
MVQVKSVDYYRQQIDLVTVGADGLPKSTGANTTNDDDAADIDPPNQTESFDPELDDEE